MRVECRAARRVSALTPVACFLLNRVVMSADGSLSRANSAQREAFFMHPDGLHHALMRLNRKRVSPCTDSTRWLEDLADEYMLRRMEHEFIERERAYVRGLASAAPETPDAFVAWFEQLRLTGPGQGDELFPWLEHEASAADMKWFLTQEMAGEAGFDDLVALTQVKLQPRAKLELARNYWDEMGQGHGSGMHGPMLDALAKALDLRVDVARTVWESLALANLMSGLAANRHYTYQAIGALGAIELTAPARSAHVNAGLKRLQLSGEARRYYALHATLDVKHAAAWQREVLHPIVAADPRTARLIAEGALMRLTAGARCFTRYRQTLLRAESPQEGR